MGAFMDVHLPGGHGEGEGGNPDRANCRKVKRSDGADGHGAF